MAKLCIHIIKKDELKFNVVGLSEDKTTWYSIPDNCQDLDLHPELLKVKTIVNSTKSISRIGGYRKINIPFTRELMEKYMDDDGNFCINEHYLEECTVGENGSLSVGDTANNTEIFFIRRIKELETQISSMTEVNLMDVEKKFLLNKYNGKQEASTWLNSFEGECIRFKICDNTKKVEALKYFIEGNVLEWYSSCLIKLSLSDWDSWKKSFLLVYKRKDWTSIRTAFNFKYMGGSFTDFVLKKERLLLDADKDMPEKFRVFQIVYALPVEIQDKLDREKINNFDDLLVELKSLNIPSKKNVGDNSYEERKRLDIFKPVSNGKKPCGICEGLGFKHRYHPTHLCRNKDLQQRKTINWTEEDEDDEKVINEKN